MTAFLHNCLSAFQRLCVLLLVLGPLSCVSPPPPPPPAKPPAPPPAAPKPAPPKVNPVVERLLFEAGRAMAARRLTTPAEDNAWYRYLRVLTLEPGNARAEQGIAEIAEQYLEWALRRIEVNDFEKAKEYLSRARLVAPRHPNLAPIEQRMREVRSRQQRSIPLAPDELKRRSPVLAQELSRIGAGIRDPLVRVVIRARSDAEGRWIYQRLTEQEREHRLRAEILIENPPSLTILTHP